MISIRHLKKDYGSVTPLSDVNIEIEKGEVISVIGPSGTGKSTLLRCLNLLETPTAGEIWVEGQNITAQSADIPALRRRMRTSLYAKGRKNKAAYVREIQGKLSGKS